LTPPSRPQNSEIRLFGLLDRKPRWSFSLRGWACFLLLALGFSALLLFATYPFLSITQQLPTDILVVEGWIPEYAIRVAAHEITNNRYTRVYTTGGPVAGTGPYSNDFNTSASVAYSRLVAAGVPQNLLQKVPCRVRDRDRTFSAAVALRDWFNDHNLHPKSFNLLTESVHSRRSRLLFQKAFGPGTQIGIIAIPPDDYPANRWWRYSAGVKDVISESAAYVYARLFFWP
jgi:uncharacterized SAM-binding protein YcdF (DUF218 family)